MSMDRESGVEVSKGVFLALLDQHSEECLIRPFHVALPGPTPPPMPQRIFRSEDYAILQIVTDGVVPVTITTQAREVQDLRLVKGEAYLRVPGAWDLRSHATARTLLTIRYQADCIGFSRTQRDPSTPLRSGPRIWRHTANPLGAAGAQTLQAMCACAEHSEDPEGMRHLLRALSYFTRSALAADSDGPRGRAHNTWQILREYIDDHHHLPINRDCVAQQFGLAADYVSRLFSEQGGEPFSHYLTRRRMDRAARLLAHPMLPLEHVAQRCGYTSANYFIKVFRRHYGTTPDRYRRDLRRTAATA